MPQKLLWKIGSKILVCGLTAGYFSLFNYWLIMKISSTEQNKNVNHLHNSTMQYKKVQLSLWKGDLVP